MGQKQNLHTHTKYVDGKDAPEELVEAAICRGFDSIGFSEHSFSRNSGLAVERMEAYKKEIRALKHKYQGRINVFCGLEYDFDSTVCAEDFDYLIGSVHYIENNGIVINPCRSIQEILEKIDIGFGGDGLTFAKRYFELVARLPEKLPFDIIGHFDLITRNIEKNRFVDVSSPAYLNGGFEAIHALKGKIPFFELNTGAVSRGHRMDPYPQMAFVREFCRAGFGAVITSDCHDKRFIDGYYDEAAELLAEAGFRSKWILTDDGFKEVGL